ncbi:MAG: LemA family protein [Pseudomonadota bacterium]|nr:LemA family protein [Pseudomonadota bacterium]MDQ6882086.1 LemA family protein [Pseudomonadota bacterium]
MSNSLLLWGVAAVVLFWSVGAYNRLVRLRSDANEAFAVMAAGLAGQAELVHASLPASMIHTGLTQPGELLDEVTELWSGLRAAATQLTVSVAAMRPRPLQPDTAAALSQARDVLLSAWVRVAQEADDLAGSSIPEALTQQWQQLTAQSRAASDNFNRAVERYNDGIAQFPAILLAALFGFKPGRGV